MSDTASVFSDGSKRGYTMSAHAVQQRAVNADRKRWFTDMRDLSEKLSLKANDFKLVNEINASLLKVFTFSDMVGLYRKEYDAMLASEALSLQVHNNAAHARALLAAEQNARELELELKRKDVLIHQLQWQMTLPRSSYCDIPTLVPPFQRQHEGDASTDLSGEWSPLSQSPSF